MTDPGPTARPDDRSLGQILGDLTANLSELVRQELALARAEIEESAARAGRAGGMAAAALVAVQLVLLFLSVALWWALGDSMGRAWAALVVGVVWAVVAAVLLLVARRQVSQIRGIPRTTETVKKIPNALEGHEEAHA